MSEQERPAGPLDLVDRLAGARRSTSTLIEALEHILALCDDDSDEQKAERSAVRSLVASGTMRLDGSLAEAELTWIIAVIHQTAEAALGEVAEPLRCEAFALVGEPCSAEATVFIADPAAPPGPRHFCERHAPPEHP